MASNGGDSNAVIDMENWRIRINTEQRLAKAFPNEWAYLTGPPGTPAHLKEPHARATAKYFSGTGAYTLATKRVPLQGRDAELAKTQEREYLATATAANERPSTALQATLFSHRKHLEHIDTHNMAFQQTSRKYGSRHTLEQFGVSDFGLTASRSKLPSN